MGHRLRDAEVLIGSEIHAAHTPHSAAGHWRGSLFLWSLGNHGFRRNQKTGNGSRVLQSRTNDFHGIDDACLEHVDILLGLGIKAEGAGLAVIDLADHDRPLDAGVLGDLTDRSLEGAQNDVDARLHVGVLGFELGDRGLGPE